MKRMLIAENNEPLMAAIEKIFSDQFQIRTCTSGEAALMLIGQFRPDVLLLNLSLPYKDGLTVLQEAAYTPPVILVTTNYTSPYIEQCCLSLGVGYLMLSPTVNAVRVRIADMVSQLNEAYKPLPDQVQWHLHILNFPTHHSTSPRLVDAVVLFHQDRDQCLKQCLYPEVARRNNCNAVAAERSIGRMIGRAWHARDPVVWESYRLNTPAAPSVKQFLDAIVKKLK